LKTKEQRGTLKRAVKEKMLREGTAVGGVFLQTTTSKDKKENFAGKGKKYFGEI